jgi:hypothetical protein
MRPLGPLVLVASLVGPMSLRAGSVPVADPAQPVVPLPAGIADPAGRTGYVANPAGGIDAIDLVTGDVLWQTTEAQRPLLAAGERLYAQAGVKRNRLRVLAFDLAHKGEVVLESDAVVLPAWAVAGEAPGHSFAIRARLERGQLLLTWEARAWHFGPRPTPEAEAAARHHSVGAARIDLNTGEVRLQAHEAAPTPAWPRDLEKRVVRWQGVVGKHFKALVLEEDSDGQKLTLRCYDLAGNPAAPPRELLRGKRLVAQPTLDERFLCLRDAAPGPDQKESVPAEERKGPTWSLFSTDSGERVERAPFLPNTQAIALLGPRIYYLQSGPIRGPIDRPFLQPRVLTAVDLKSGKALWEHPVEGRQVTPPSP